MSAVDWVSELNGNWATLANWAYGVKPTASDDAIFILPGDYTVALTSPVAVDGITFNAPGAILDQTSGSLSLGVDGMNIYNGVVSLNDANSFGSDVNIYGGILKVGNSAALGTAAILSYGGLLLATRNVTLSNNISFASASTIAAARGATLTLWGNCTIDSPATLTIGAAGDTGTVVWENGSLNLNPSSYSPSLDVRAGTFVFEGWYDGLAALGSDWASVDIESGATLDLGGSPSDFNSLVGGGTLTASDTTSLTVNNANFSGNISGDINLVATGDVQLYGSSVFGSLLIGNGSAFASLTNNVGAVLDYDTSSSIGENTGATFGFFFNDGTFIRNGQNQNGTVSVPFINTGTMRITTGSMTFTDGFYNSGVVEGVLTTIGGATTWTPAPVQEDFNGDGYSDVLLVNGSGAFLEWNLNGSAITSVNGLTFGGQPYTPPSSWHVAGIGDFNGDGMADVLWRATNGDIYDWTMDGSQIESIQQVANVGSSWSVAGTGDFNGDGKADVLWRNTNGEIVDWTMDGSQIASNQEVTYQGAAVSKDSSWSVAGVGDFNGDGKTDVLWRNTNGALIDWTMNGSQIESSQQITYKGAAFSLDSSWSVAGIGDFNGDGEDDILWRNTNGALIDWTMNGSQIESSQPITYHGAAVSPGPSWSVAEIGNFNGNGIADILWRNTNGALDEWAMNGATVSSASSLTYQGNAVNLGASHIIATPRNQAFG